MIETIDTAANRAALPGIMADHRAADRIAKGNYWRDGKGCAVGCAMHSLAPEQSHADHAYLGRLLDAPESLMRLVDFTFEGLPHELSMDWPTRFSAALLDSGKDSAALQLAAYRHTHRVLDWVLAQEYAAPVRAACLPALVVALRLADGEAVSRTASEAAAEAARAAGNCVGADAGSAAEAARSSVGCAAYAARAAGWADEADTWAMFADWLIEEIAR